MMQFIFVNAEILKIAQRNPEKYQDLPVRVAHIAIFPLICQKKFKTTLYEE